MCLCVYYDDGIIFRKLSVVCPKIITSNKIIIGVLASLFIVKIVQNCLPINNLRQACCIVYLRLTQITVNIFWITIKIRSNCTK